MLYYLEKRALKKIMPSRQDGGPVLKLFSLKDFPDMTGEEFCFYSGKNKLRGIKYRIPNSPCKGAVVFFHGMGAGHNAYEKFIHTLALNGYLVYAYDNACCGMSEGDGWWNFSSALIDQENFFKWFETDPDKNGLKIIAIGHSWGGFVAQNALRYNVDKVVSISGFCNVVDLFIGSNPRLKPLKFILKGMQRHYYGAYGNVNTYDLLKETEKDVLIIHGDKDPLVSYEKNFSELKEKLQDKKNVIFYTAEDRLHQPHMSKKAEAYLKYLSDEGIATGEKKVDSIDYALLLEENEELWKVIFKFID